MHLNPDYSYDPHTTSELDYIDSLYAIFLQDLVQGGLHWKSPDRPIALRRQEEFEGRHYSFWHIVSGGDPAPENRNLEPERCARIAWIRPMIEQFNADFPHENELRWWKSDRSPGSNTVRYVLATPSYDYVILIDEKPTYAPLVTAYYVEKAHRRGKLQKEHDNFWSIKQEPLA